MATTYFVTGASGFIGKRLVRALLARPGARVHYLMRDISPQRVAALNAFWGEGAGRASPVKGDLLRNGVSLPDVDLMIATAALVHDLTLVTNNTTDFQNIPGLRLEDWLTP